MTMLTMEEALAAAQEAQAQLESASQEAQALVAAANLQIAEIEIGIITPLMTSISSAAFAPLVAEIDAARTALISGHIYEQLGHLRATLINLPVNLEQRVEAINLLLTPPPTPPNPPA